MSDQENAVRSLESCLVCIADGGRTGGGWDIASADRFVNLVFEGLPQGLYTRRTEKNTEVFITPKWKGDVIQKVTIAPSFRGIAQPGACSVMRFDLESWSVSLSQLLSIVQRSLRAPAAS